MKLHFGLLALLTTMFFLSSCGKYSNFIDFTEEDRNEALRSLPAEVCGAESTFSDNLAIADLIFVGSIAKSEEATYSYTSNGKQEAYKEHRYTVRVDELWAGEIVGKMVTIESDAIRFNDDIFLDHPDNSFVFILYPDPRTVQTTQGENPYVSVSTIKTIIPVQPSTGNLYFLLPFEGTDEFDGHPPEKLKEYIQDLQQQVLDAGYDAVYSSLKPDRLGLVLQPYQTAYETGKPVEFIPYVIRKLIEGPLSAYEGEPYYDALLTRVKKAYNSRKSRWGMTEGKLYSILEGMLPKLVKKAEEECG